MKTNNKSRRQTLHIKKLFLNKLDIDTSSMTNMEIHKKFYEIKQDNVSH